MQLQRERQTLREAQFQQDQKSSRMGRRISSIRRSSLGMVSNKMSIETVAKKCGLAKNKAIDKKSTIFTKSSRYSDNFTNS